LLNRRHKLKGTKVSLARSGARTDVFAPEVDISEIRSMPGSLGFHALSPWLDVVIGNIEKGELHPLERKDSAMARALGEPMERFETFAAINHMLVRVLEFDAGLLGYRYFEKENALYEARRQSAGQAEEAETLNQIRWMPEVYETAVVDIEVPHLSSFLGQRWELLISAVGKRDKTDPVRRLVEQAAEVRRRVVDEVYAWEYIQNAAQRHLSEIAPSRYLEPVLEKMHEILRGEEEISLLAHQLELDLKKRQDAIAFIDKFALRPGIPVGGGEVELKLAAAVELARQTAVLVSGDGAQAQIESKMLAFYKEGLDNLKTRYKSNPTMVRQIEEFDRYHENIKSNIESKYLEMIGRHASIMRRVENIFIEDTLPDGRIKESSKDELKRLFKELSKIQVRLVDQRIGVDRVLQTYSLDIAFYEMVLADGLQIQDLEVQRMRREDNRLFADYLIAKRNMDRARVRDLEGQIEARVERYNDLYWNGFFEEQKEAQYSDLTAYFELFLGSTSALIGEKPVTRAMERSTQRFTQELFGYVRQGEETAAVFGDSYVAGLLRRYLRFRQH
jgi:hypothetical protein